ncbi:MAG: AraC family transcriptional regulator [Piscinibacter sp.]|nr:AraC family transcriptional regulator [Piscinibacter sp.]
MAFVRAMVAAYRKYGQDPAEALREARITPAQLRRPDARIDALQMETVSARAMQELDDEALGWFSRRLPWGSYGMLCRASIGAPDLGVALKRWCRHHRLLVEDVRLSLSTDGPAATLAIAEAVPLGEFREIALVTLLRSVHGFACWAIDSRIPLREAAFPFAAPPHADAYPAMFPGPVRFGAARAGLVFDAAYLALPLRRDEPALRTMLQRALPLTVRPYRRDRLLAQRVREQLRAGAANAAVLAEALHVSVRTLHRQLHDEGSSLQALKDEVRRDAALALLARSERPVKQVAALSGFRNAKSFARAFRQWTGQTPEQWRRAAQAP